MSKLPAPRFKDGAQIKEFRRKYDLNQTTFWSVVGMTQSAGSRYESGRDIPRPLHFLLTLAYGTDGQATKVIEYLRAWKKKP